MKDLFKGYDYTLLISPILLSLFGIMMIYSASMVSTAVEGLDTTYYLFRQLIWFVLGFIGFLFCTIFPYRHYQRYIVYIVIASVVLLLAVLAFGNVAHNAQRSIDILGMNIQPSEFIKLTLIIYLASAYSKKQEYINNFGKGILPPLALTGVMIFLIVLQPDIGTSSIILMIVATIIISSGIQMKHLLFLFTLAGGLVLLVLPRMITDTRIARFTGAYQPFLDPDDKGYHLIQSYLAIGGGGLGGEGLGQSIQKLGYLWGAHTDFIMSVIAEELGVFGVVFVIGMFTLITLRGLYIAKKCPDAFGSLMAIGISSMVAIQAVVNLGAISGLFPITGVTLPFVSYGGSSLFVLLISMGILNNIARFTKMKQTEPKVIETEPINNNKERRGTTWIT